MTDEELIARLREEDTVWCDDIASLAADRIEALVKESAEMEAEAHAHIELWGKALREKAAAEARAERLEAALNDLGLEMLRSDETQAFMQSRITTYREALSFYAKWGVENPRHDDLVRDDGGDIARAALKGADHE